MFWTKKSAVTIWYHVDSKTPCIDGTYLVRFCPVNTAGGEGDYRIHTANYIRGQFSQLDWEDRGMTIKVTHWSEIPIL